MSNSNGPYGGFDRPVYDGVVSEGEEPEYRIRVSSKGEAPVFWLVEGDDRLEVVLRHVADIWPNDVIYVTEITEHLVKVVKPGGEVTNIS